MEKNRTCKHCKQLFENIEGKVFANHVRWCDKNPKDRTNELALRNEKLKKIANDKFGGKFNLFKVSCNKCNKEFEVREREKLFPKKEKYFCSRSCANSKSHTEETKQKIAKSLLLPITNKCKYCNDFCKSKRSKFCSKKCRYDYLFLSKLNRLETEIEKEKLKIQKYRVACSFNFNLADYPDKFDFNLIKQFRMV